MALSELYLTCEDLPMKLFLKIMNENNLFYLYRDYKEEFSERLIETWENILEEYEKLSGDTGVTRGRELTNTIRYLECQIMRIEAAVKYLELREEYSSFINLKEDGYVLNVLKNICGVKENTPGEREKAIRKAKSFFNRLNSLKKQTQDESEDQKPVTFDEIMAELYGFGYQNISDNLSVSRYLAIKKVIKNGIRKKQNNKQ